MDLLLLLSFFFYSCSHMLALPLESIDNATECINNYVYTYVCMYVGLYIVADVAKFSFVQAIISSRRLISMLWWIISLIVLLLNISNFLYLIIIYLLMFLIMGLV